MKHAVNAALLAMSLAFGTAFAADAPAPAAAPARPSAVVGGCPSPPGRRGRRHHQSLLGSGRVHPAGLLAEDDAVIVEWPERAGPWLPAGGRRFRLTHLPDPARRGLEELA